jgi:hypothetical protein
VVVARLVLNSGRSTSPACSTAPDPGGKDEVSRSLSLGRSILGLRALPLPIYRAHAEEGMREKAPLKTHLRETGSPQDDDGQGKRRDKEEGSAKASAPTSPPIIQPPPQA